MADDTPRMWTEEVNYDPETGEILDDTPITEPTDIVPVEEVPLPTTEEQTNIIKQSNLSEENKSLLNSIVELNAICDVMDKTAMTETQEKQI